MRARALGIVSLIGWIPLIACSESTAPLDAGLSTDAGFRPDAAAPDTGPEPEPDAGPVEVDSGVLSSSWCDRVTPGPRGTRSIEVDLSAAHAAARFFGTDGEYDVIDQPLAIALAAADALQPSGIEAALVAYAEPLAGVCALEASDAVLGAARVEMAGTVAVIVPGTGAITVPANATAIAIDLRDLPNVPELRDALAAAASASLTGTLELDGRTVRIHDGMVDEYFTAMNVYSTATGTVGGGRLTGTAASDLPLAVLTGPRLAPAAATLAGTLRLAGRAWIIGVSVLAEVAESDWQGIGDHGLAYRTGYLFDRTRTAWPDVIPADLEAAEPRDRLAELETLGAPAPFAGAVRDRAEIKQLFPFGRGQQTAIDLGSMRAALIIVHGALRAFFPYFDVVGDRIDERLTETLASAETAIASGAGVYHLLRRFGESIRDGHNFVFDMANARGITGVIPLLVESIGGQPVVFRSGVPGIDAGDTLIAIDGEPALDWYARELARTSAATDGYRFDIAGRQLMSATGPRDFTVRAPGGIDRLVTAEPQEMFEESFFAPSRRATGLLADLGAPAIMYVNLDGSSLTDLADFRRAISSTVATALILDMRGYPGVNHYEVANRVIHGEHLSPVFRVPFYTGPHARRISETQYQLGSMGIGAYWDGPVVLIVGPHTVSAAENFSMMLAGVNRATIVGRRSAGTNGNICAMLLPMSFAFSFTCMEVLFPDRSLFHGVGIVPDVEVTPAAIDYRDGRDVELEAAIDALGG